MTTPSTVFVTGGSGFIGSHLLEDLSRDHLVHALARSDAAATRVRAYGARAVRGELASVTPADLAGVDVVVHAAALVEAWATPAEFFATNVTGTRTLLAAAQAAGVRRFIHLACDSVLFDGRDLRRVDERAPYPARHRFPYPATKAEAERLVLAAAAPDVAPLSLRPRLVWGPRDTTLMPTLRRLVDHDRWSWLDHGRAVTSTTHVKNVVHAVRLALTRGRAGEAYFIADDGERSLRQFLTALLATSGIPLPDTSAPSWLARPLARTVERTWRLLRLRRAPPLTAFEVALMSTSVTVDTAKARAELGYAPVVTVADGIGSLTAPDPIPEIVVRATAPHARPPGRSQGAAKRHEGSALDAGQDDADPPAEGRGVAAPVDERAGEP